jgi:hypothetical protein
LNAVSTGDPTDGSKEKYLPNIIRQAIDICELNYANTRAGATPAPDPYGVYTLAYTLRRIEELSGKLAEIYKIESEGGNSDKTKEDKQRADAITSDLKSAVTFLLLQRRISPEQTGKLTIIQSEIARSYIELRASLNPILRICTQTAERNSRLLDELDPFKKHDQQDSASSGK